MVAMGWHVMSVLVREELVRRVIAGDSMDIVGELAIDTARHAVSTVIKDIMSTHLANLLL